MMPKGCPDVVEHQHRHREGRERRREHNARECHTCHRRRENYEKQKYQNQQVEEEYTKEEETLSDELSKLHISDKLLSSDQQCVIEGWLTKLPAVGRIHSIVMSKGLAAAANWILKPLAYKKLGKMVSGYIHLSTRGELRNSYYSHPPSSPDGG